MTDHITIHRAEAVELPWKYREGLDAWVSGGHKPGGFLCAMLRNDLQDALCRADSTSLSLLLVIAGHIRWHLPKLSHGSKERMDAWEDAGGTDGIERAKLIDAACDAEEVVSLDELEEFANSTRD